MLAPLLAVLALAGPAVDNVTDHSARLTGPAPLAVEYGTSRGYGLYARSAGNVLTLTNLAAATAYHVRTPGGSDVTFVTKQPAAVPHTLRIGPRRSLRLDRRPFIPIMQWLQCPSLFDTERALGIDVFMGRGCSDVDDVDEVRETATRGAFSILPFDASVAGTPGLLAWRGDDEPDLNHVRVGDVARATRRGHPRLTFVTLTSGFFGPTRHDVPSAAYARAADVVGFDVYPVYGYCRPDLIWWQADATKALVRVARRGQPVYSWIEAASTSSQWCKGRGVLPRELRAEVWMTLANGATAIGYFTHSWRPDYTQFRVSRNVRAEMKRTDRQVKTLTPAILGVPSRVVVTTDGGRVDAFARSYGGARYVFAVNVSHERVQARFAADGDGAWHVFEEGRTVQASSGSFADTFAPLAVHVYVRPPSR